MKIIKYKKLPGNKYKITLDNNDVILYEDIIIKNMILLKKNIKEDELKQYLNENIFYEGYYKALNYIKFRMRSTNEIEKYLAKEFNKDLIEKIILNLTKEGYLNDDYFTKCYINDSINLKNIGPNKIIHELEKLGTDKSIIDKNIKVFTKEKEEEKIKKIIDKKVKTNKNKSVYNLKNNIKLNLINQGFNVEIIDKNINNINFDETSIYEKEYNKLYNKLSKKYTSYELEQKIKQKLYQKGLFK